MPNALMVYSRRLENAVDRGFTGLKIRYMNRNRARDCRSYLKNADILTPEEKQQLLAFWKPYVKKPSLVYFAYYKEKTGRFSPLFLPHDFFYKELDPFLNDHHAAKYLDNKCLYHRLFGDFALPNELVYHCHGLFFNAHDEPITKEQARALILAQPRTFLKIAADSLGGHGVFCCNGEADAAKLDKWLNGGSDFVAQLPLTQHPDIAALHPDSINSVRIITLLMPEGVTVLATALRMGFGNAVVDNASSGGIFCGIDENGKLRKYAFRRTGERYEEHPTTGIRFEGYQIPCMEKAKETVIRAQKTLPQFRLVAWDICIDPAGEPVLIEGNFCTPGLFVPQLSTGPLLGDQTERVLQEYQAARGSAK